MADGSIAILRAHEYRVEWINHDRSHTLGPRIPYAWRPLDARERSRLADSINADHQHRYESDLALWRLDSTDVANRRPFTPRIVSSAPSVGVGNRGSGAAPASAPTGAAAALGADSGRGAGGAAVRPGASGALSNPDVRLTSEWIYDGVHRESRPYLAPRIDAASLPDTIPPVQRVGFNVLLADLDNRLWIRSGAWVTPPGQPVTYDIVNRAGLLVDRVQVPTDRTIIGFGAGGIVFLASQDGSTYTVQKVLFR